MLCRDCRYHEDMNDPSLSNRCAKDRRAEVIQGYGCELFKLKGEPEPEPKEKPKPVAKR